jgi:ribosomal protein L40E
MHTANHFKGSFAMSSSLSLQCLFCQHINPAGASFCNGCGSQLNLQPCLQCDTVDNRTATHCYKCGAPFSSSPSARNRARKTSGQLQNEHTPLLRYPAYLAPEPKPVLDFKAPLSRLTMFGTRRM